MQLMASSAAAAPVEMHSADNGGGRRWEMIKKAAAAAPCVLWRGISGTCSLKGLLQQGEKKGVGVGIRERARALQFFEPHLFLPKTARPANVGWSRQDRLRRPSRRDLQAPQHKRVGIPPPANHALYGKN